MSKTCNVEPVNKVKSVLLTKITELIDNGRAEITTKDELTKYSIGSLISYMNKNGIFKTAGFLIKVASEYFIYITPDFQQKYRVYFSNVQKMWAGDVYKVKNDIVSIVASKNKATKFKLEINGIVIYYAKDSYSLKRFRNTQKYQRIVKWCDYFGVN